MIKGRNALINFSVKKLFAGLLAVLTVQLVMASSALANPYYRGYAYNARHSYGSYMHYHPMVHNALKDGAWGTAAGALVGLASGRGVMHGALIGAGAGAGIGALRASNARWSHPVATNVGTAGIAGLGLWMAARHGHRF